MTPEQQDCGYALYGPPALCTCGTCDVDPEDQEAALLDLLETLNGLEAEGHD